MSWPEVRFRVAYKMRVVRDALASVDAALLLMHTVSSCEGLTVGTRLIRLPSFP